MEHLEADDLRSKEVGLDIGDGMNGMGGRILEIRKEKSRDAARSRRGKENYEFYELAKLLPLPAAITSQLDKASIIRLSISYLKLRQFSVQGDPPWSRDGPPPNKSLKNAQRRRSSTAVAMELFELHQGAHILQSLDGFAFTLSSDGRFLYISETVSIYLGLSQVEMAGSSIFEYVHHQDHQELADQLGLGLGSVTSTLSSPSSPASDSTPSTPRPLSPPVSDRVPLMTPSMDKGRERLFCIRMKSTLTKRGVHVRSSGYRVVQIIGRFRHEMSFSMNRKSASPLLGLVGLAIALPPPSVNELRIEADTFIMRLSPDFKVVYCDNVISTLTDWKAEDISGKDLYSFCHAGDLNLLRKAHMDLLSKGQVLSPSIRIMNKTGGYIVTEICATSLYNNKGTDDQTVLAIYHVLSGVEQRDCVMDAGQVPRPDHDERRHLGERHSDLSDRNCSIGDEREQSSKHCSGTDHQGSDVSSYSSNNVCVNSKAITTSTTKQSHDSGKLLQPHNDGDTDMEQGDKVDMFKFENKVSRRKTDRPRKRRRESDDECFFHADGEADNVGFCQETDGCHVDTLLCKNSDDAMGGRNQCASTTTSLSLPDSPDANMVDNLTPPQVPEDLSVRHLSEQSSCTRESSLMDHGVSKMISSSVMDLEEAMNRHLPSTNKTVAHSADVSNGDLSSVSAHKQKSTIQWIGGSGANSSQNSETMSASAFLRHLYANRESVIRSNGRPQFFNGDIPTAINMLTPPGSDLYKDHLHLNIPQISVLNSKGQATPYSATSMAMSNNNPTDSYSMTPPSSVSPQEKLQSPFQDNQLPECSGMMGGASLDDVRNGNGKQHSFPPMLSPITSIADYDAHKSPYISLPAYQGNGSIDLHTFSQGNNAQNGILSYDSRLANTGPWYGSAYTS